MSASERVRVIVEPLADAADIELVDVEHNGSVLRVTVDHPDGVKVDVLQKLSREVSRILDEEDPIAGRYMLEVSSPGLERPLKKFEHYQRALGELVAVKTKPGVDGPRRVKGTLVTVDESGIELDVDESKATSSEARRRLRYNEISSARTVFEWGPTPKPGGKTKATGGKNKGADAKKPASSKKSNKPGGATKPKPGGGKNKAADKNKPAKSSQGAHNVAPISNNEVSSS